MTIQYHRCTSPNYLGVWGGGTQTKGEDGGIREWGAAAEAESPEQCAQQQQQAQPGARCIQCRKGGMQQGVTTPSPHCQLSHLTHPTTSSAALITSQLLLPTYCLSLLLQHRPLPWLYCLPLLLAQVKPHIGCCCCMPHIMTCACDPPTTTTTSTAPLSPIASQQLLLLLLR